MSVASMIPAMVDQVITQGAPRAKAPKASKRPAAAVTKTTVKKSWYVTPEGSKRLGITAVMEGRSESDIVSELLEGLNRYTMPSANTRASKSAHATADTEEHRQDATAA